MFNLMEDAWLPVRDTGGRVTHVSLRRALLDAHEFAGLAVQTPTQVPAVLRHTLLPLLLTAQFGPPRSHQEWGTRYAAGAWTAARRKHLDEHLTSQRDAFDLFHPERPFAQVGGLEAQNGETKPISLLVPSVASGNNVPLFTAFTDSRPLSLTPEEAALWLLHAHCWDTAAIKTGARGDDKVSKGKTTGNPTGPLGQFGVIVPEGATLYETLMLNTPVLPDGLNETDRPNWTDDESTGPGWESRPAHGLLDALTWQSRRLRLLPDETDEGLRVSRVLVCAGDRLEAVREDFEWHTAWTHNPKPKKGQLALRPRRHRSGEYAWQGLPALLELVRDEEEEGPLTSRLLRQIGTLEAEDLLPSEAPLRVRTCGVVYGTQSAVIEDVLADYLPLPTAALAADSRTRFAVLEAAEQAGAVARLLNRLSADLRRAEGGDPMPWDKGQRPATTFLHAVDAPMRRLLGGLRLDADDEDRLEQGMEAWELVVHRLAREQAERLLAEASPATFRGHDKEERGVKRRFRATTARRHFYTELGRSLSRAAEARKKCNDGTDDGSEAA